VMGLEVLAWIRQQPGAGLIVILLTASGQLAEIASAYRLGANAFLTKPSEASKLVDMAKAIKDFWLTHNMPPQESLNGVGARSLNGSVAQRKTRNKPTNLTTSMKKNRRLAARKIGLVLCAALLVALGALTCCVGYVDQPRPRAAYTP